MIVSTNKSNPNALKLLIGGEISGNSVDVRIVPTNDSPLGRLPTLKLPNGITLISSNAALQYLVPGDEQQDVLVNKWLEWDSTQLQPAVVSYGSSGSLDTSHKPRIWSLLTQLNTSLKSQKYVITASPTSADIAIFSTLWCTITVTEISKELSTEFPHVDRWLKDLEALPAMQSPLSKLPLLDLERGLKSISSLHTSTWFPLNSYTGVRSQKPPQDVNTPSSPTKEPETAITKHELETSRNNWSSPAHPSIKPPTYPVLPKQNERNILITSALPYVNNVPHLGNIIGCVLSADVFARYCRQRDYNTLYISGTDEYGTATEAKALEENMTPQEICDKYFGIHNDIYRWFNIGFDYFGRTTTPEQTEIVQESFLRIKSQGYIITESVDQLLCEHCDRFLADRFVEGTCPGCKYEDARGDQCDGCGHLVNATDLINPRCKVCSKTPVIKASNQFFLDLPKIQPNLKEWASKAEKFWSNVARAVTRPWLRDGLKQRCITRDLKWGIPVPLEGFRDKVFYVWFDAPLGYISITKRYTQEYERWWKPREDTKVDLYQFMAKDNVPFHAIMFPATLLAADQGHTLVKHIMATEYLNYEDTKFSKSRGIGVFGTDARETGIPADVWRFYLTYIRPESQDSNFNWVDLATKNNSELLNNFGNFVNRALTFAVKNFKGVVPEMEIREEDLQVLALVQRELSQYIVAMEQGKFRDGVRHLLAISKHGNQYMQSQQPWVLIKEKGKDRVRAAGTVIGVCCNISCLLSALLGPFMPETSRELRKQLGLDGSTYGYIPDTVSILLPTGHQLGEASPLFSKIEESVVEELRKKYAGKQENGNNGTRAGESVEELQALIAAQGVKVRELKAKTDKSVWQPEVQILLQLKGKLAKMTESSEGTVNTATIGVEKQVNGPTQNGKNEYDIAALEAAIARQALFVRDLKASADRSVWQPEVNTLLKLKKELSDATGVITPNPGDKKSKKKK
ncbi:methionine--tRNA ligase, cytoplasmic [Diachasma alloeum]|uniref:methionine--tRNA ligase, cytoplasmic n=1 Tax=Diachasma alloeum TaxID=454923 RepID=UPI00073814D9|nr:methionine--tRNA ligase, cytoplasmic [Diachasma alloeum]